MLRKNKQIVELPLFAEARVQPQYKKRRFSRFTRSAVYLFVMVAIFCGVFIHWQFVSMISSLRRMRLHCRITRRLLLQFRLLSDAPSNWMFQA
ncbi:hypothetical protein IPL68_01555 [Candidatus Saccharibacteria bacterium]|nr:MAG: hypothetical protein IPL68_01555 [Candidatus Saccharibacteria bacterium]